MAQQQMQVLVLPEGYERLLGGHAIKANISAAKAVSDAVKTTLGPKGMDKMLVDDMGDITITNDGATIVDKLKVEHPAAKLMVEIAKTQDKEVGDGTTTALIYAGKLLEGAMDLFEKDIHPSVIISGYKAAQEHIQKYLEDNARDIDLNDNDALIKIASVSVAGKTLDVDPSHIGKLCVEAIKTIAETTDGKLNIDQDNVQIIKKKGGAVSDSEIVKGMVIEKEVVHAQMLKKVTNAKILLLNAAIEVKKTETKGEIEIDSPAQMQAFLDEEEKMLKDMVESVKKTGANVVFCQKGIDDMAQYYLAKSGIMAARRVKESDMKKLSKATNAKIINSMRNLSSDSLGKAGVVEQTKMAGDDFIFVRECVNPKVATIILRGGTEHVIDELERAIKDGLGSLSSALEMKKIVTGGGAVEIAAAEELRKFAVTQSGKEQLAVKKFADALEDIPKTLAESAGMDVIDTLVNLRKHYSEGKNDYGVDVVEGKTSNMYEKNVVEPLKVKIQALKSATEAVDMILRIDDVIASTKRGGGMPPGM